MKLKTTQKAIRGCYDNILKIGYCDLPYLLYYESPFAYNAGVYGWNCDYYDLSNICGRSVAICTGYRPHGERVDSEVVRKYEMQAQQLVLANKADRETLRGLIRHFVEGTVPAD